VSNTSGRRRANCHAGERLAAVLAKWKPASVLDQGKPCAGDASLDAFRPIVVDFVKGTVELPETTDSTG
jgi:hypothetical protein